MWSKETLSTELVVGRSIVGSGWDVIPRLHAWTPTGSISVLCPAIAHPHRQEQAAAMLKAFLKVEFAFAITLLYQTDDQSLIVIGLSHTTHGCAFDSLAADFDLIKGGALFGRPYRLWPEHVPTPLLFLLPFKDEPLDRHAYRDLLRCLELPPPEGRMWL